MYKPPRRIVMASHWPPKEEPLSLPSQALSVSPYPSQCIEEKERGQEKSSALADTAENADDISSSSYSTLRRMSPYPIICKNSNAQNQLVFSSSLTSSTPHLPYRFQSQEESILIEEETQRMAQRVNEALADQTGRLKLDLSHSQCAMLPYEMGRLFALRELTISYCPKLHQVPISLTQLSQNLEVLDLSCCGLRTLPEEFSNMSLLKYLDVSHNELEAWIWNPGELTRNLTHLDLSHNNIRYFSFENLSLFQHLKKNVEEVSFKNDLYPKMALYFHENPFLKVNEIDPNAMMELLTFVPPISPLSELLPPLVNTCCACEKEIPVHRPFVFVKFIQCVSGIKNKAETTFDSLQEFDYVGKGDETVCGQLPRKIPHFMEEGVGDEEINFEREKTANDGTDQKKRKQQQGQESSATSVPFELQVGGPLGQCFRLPIFYPYCGVECCKVLHRRISLTSRIATSIFSFTAEHDKKYQEYVGKLYRARHDADDSSLEESTSEMK